MEPSPKILVRASFHPAVRTYWNLQISMILICTFFGALLVPFWWFLGGGLRERAFARLRCALTPRTLEIQKGVLVRSERTIPLDKIQDLTIHQGPIMRMLGIESLRVETAGQSVATGMGEGYLLGIVDARGFRDAVLRERDLLEGRSEERAAGPAAETARDLSGAAPLLEQIRDSLVRIESGLADVEAHLRRARE